MNYLLQSGAQYAGILAACLPLNSWRILSRQELAFAYILYSREYLLHITIALMKGVYPLQQPEHRAFLELSFFTFTLTN